MGRIVAFLSVTLDGVMQSPAAPDEDPRGGFSQGGWAAPYADSMIQGLAAEGAETTEGILFGRRTYEHLHSVWAHATGNPFSDILNSAPKYVASRTLQEPLVWENSTLLGPDGAGAVGELRSRLPKDLVVLGSGELIRSLMPHGLVDRFILLTHPVVLGSGIRLFEPRTAVADLQLVDSRTSTTGVIVATYDVVSARPT